MKKTKLLSSIIGMTFVFPVIGTFLGSTLINNSNNFDSTLNKKAENVVSKFEAQNNISNPIVAVDRYNKSPILVESTGPIVSYGSKIYALDWYASKRWEVDLMSTEYTQYFPGQKNDNFGTSSDSPKRAFRNWNLDVQNNKLWILTNSQKVKEGNETRAYPQTILCFDSLTGKFIKHYQMKVDSFQGQNGSGTINQYRLYEQIAVLKNGNILVYSFSNWWNTQLLDLKTGEFTINNSKPAGFEEFINKQGGSPGTIRLYQLIPVYENMNIAVLGSILYGNADNANATGDLYLGLVDDDFNRINVTDSTSPWFFNSDNSKGMHIIKNPYGTDKPSKYDSKVSGFSRSYYYTIDGNVVTTMFSSLFVFERPKKGSEKTYGVKFAEHKFENNKEISSFTMDVNDNIYFKIVGDKNIYKMIIDTSRGINSTIFTQSTYYNLGNFNNTDVSNNAENFILYNVKGYSGSIMLINTNPSIDGTLSSSRKNTVDSSKWGLAVAIIPNANSPESGDSKGLLNSEKSILKSSDFEINESILSSKLPSEITREDITILNDGFFTSNKVLDNQGNLKYPPFKLANIDDSQGTFDVIVNLDQIPWFATKLPSDAIPKTITKSYKNGTIAQKINTKTSWKDSSNLSYDFKNTLPTKVTLEDINNFDPFQVSFNSRTVLNADGTIKYPKKTYSIGNKNDVNGTIDINVKYEYMPVSSEVNDVLTYNGNKTYTIFKSGSNKQFYFAGSSSGASENSSQTIDVKNVPQLKYLSESNMLPSSFDASNKNNFLPFVNTNKSSGFPLSKMNFTVQPNDEAGELTIRAELPHDYYNQRYVFTQRYSGLNKKTNYDFKFNNVNQINGQNFNTMLPSSVNEGDVINDLITYTGFSSNDFTVNLIPNNDNGSLNVRILLDKNYPNDLAVSKGFNNYVIEKEYLGFMTSSEFNNQYNIDFYDDASPELIEIKKLTLSEIENQINSKNLTIKDVKYTSLNDLIDKMFIKTRGIRIPNNWSSHDNDKKITTNMSINNEAGTMNISITISGDLLNGYGSDLNFVQSYSGFSKGNKNPTGDSLSFVSQDLLKVSVPEIANMSANDMKSWLENDKKNIKKLLFSVSGQYEEFLSSNNFELDIKTNDSYNSITITLTFTGTLTNAQSLKSYSIQYML